MPLTLILCLALKKTCYFGFIHHVFLDMEKIPLRDLFTRLSSLSCLGFLLSEMLHYLTTVALHCPYPCMSVSLLCWRVQSQAQHSRCVSWQLRKGITFNLLARLCLMQPRVLLVHSAASWPVCVL